MSEFVSAWHFSEQEQIEKIDSTGNEALTIVDTTYGTGYPENQPGERTLAYHNGHHARSVGRTAFRLCVLLDLPQIDRITAKSAGFAHDLVQLKGRGIDEGESAAWIKQQLSTGDIVSPDQRGKAALAILGTEPLFENGKIVGQKATSIDYLTHQAELVAKSVAAGDLGELYTPQGPLLGHQLFHEIQGMPPTNELSMDKMTDFQRNQLGLLESYRYPLPLAERELTTHKAQVISYATQLLRMLESGSIESWDDIMRLDTQFLDHHRSA